MKRLPVIMQDRDLTPYECPGAHAAFARNRTAGFVRAAMNGGLADAARRIEIAIVSAYLQGIEDCALATMHMQATNE